MSKQPRWYQEADAIEARRRKKVLIRYPMGLGKSELATLAIWEPGVYDATPCLIASQNQSVPDWEDHLREEYPDARIAICAEQPPEIKRELLAGKFDFYVVNHNMLSVPRGKGGQKNFYHMPRVKSFVLDECFPAGTLIGEKPIEELEVGDLVPAFNGYRRVETLTCLPCNSLVRVLLSNGTMLVCTPTHPLLTPDGWVLAGEVEGHDVYGRFTGSMFDMRQNISSPIHNAARSLHWTQSSVLLTGMRARCSTEEWETARSANAHTRAESEILRANEPQQSHALAGYKSQGQYDSPSYGPSTTGSWREWIRPYGGSASPFQAVGLRLGNGARRPSWEEDTGISVSLQDRHSLPYLEDCNRSRWPFPQDLRTEICRSTEDREITLARVDRVEVLESGSDGTFGGVCRDGLVYNLHVSGDHTYLVNGVVVHNSHEKGVGRKARAWHGARQIADRAEIVLPMSGTPIRKQSDGLWAQLRLVDKSLTSYWRFVNEHCVTEETPWKVEILGSKDSMQAELAARSLYRTYPEVGLVLPNVIPYNHRVPMTEQTRTLYDRLKRDLRDEFDQPVFSAGAALSKLRRLTAHDEYKRAKMASIVRDLDQFVVFTWHRETAELLAKELKAVAITGEKDGKSRNALAKASSRIVATIASMSTSVDLSNHRDVIFYEESYEPGVMDNALGRVARWRKGSGDEPIRCRYLFCQNSIDERIHNLQSGRAVDAAQVYSERNLIAAEIAARMLA